MNAHSTARRQFLEEYRLIRRAEGRGSDTSGYYRALPFCQATDQNAAMWAMRSRTYRYFERTFCGAWNCALAVRWTCLTWVPVIAGFLIGFRFGSIGQSLSTSSPTSETDCKPPATTPSPFL